MHEGVAARRQIGAVKEPAVVEADVNNARVFRPDGDEQAPSGLMRLRCPPQLPRFYPAPVSIVRCEVGSAGERPGDAAERVDDVALDGPASVLWFYSAPGD